MNEIVQQGHPTLREVASFVNPQEILGPDIQKVIQKMHKILATQKDGVALAAPQIAEPLQIFVVSPQIFTVPQEHNLVYINPEITYLSDKKVWLDEGCLSCRWKIGQVNRSKNVRLRAYNEQAQLFEIEADELLAHIFQHETDHLKGTLFIDKARNLRDMTDAEITEAQT